MTAWEQTWLDHQALWTLELVGQPGVYNALCEMDALDWYTPGVEAWHRQIGEGS